MTGLRVARTAGRRRYYENRYGDIVVIIIIIIIQNVLVYAAAQNASRARVRRTIARGGDLSGSARFGMIVYTRVYNVRGKRIVFHT